MTKLDDRFYVVLEPSFGRIEDEHGNRRATAFKATRAKPARQISRTSPDRDSEKNFICQPALCRFRIGISLHPIPGHISNQKQSYLWRKFFRSVILTHPAAVPAQTRPIFGAVAGLTLHRKSGCQSEGSCDDRAYNPHALPQRGGDPGVLH